MFSPAVFLLRDACDDFDTLMRLGGLGPTTPLYPHRPLLYDTSQVEWPPARVAAQAPLSGTLSVAVQRPSPHIFPPLPSGALSHIPHPAFFGPNDKTAEAPPPLGLLPRYHIPEVPSLSEATRTRRDTVILNRTGEFYPLSPELPMGGSFVFVIFVICFFGVWV